MTKRDIFNMGKEYGFNVASWVEKPEIGSRVPREIDWVGYKEVTKENQQDVWTLYAQAADEAARQYAEFSFTAKELNDLEAAKRYDVWEVFEDGIEAGFRKAWRSIH